LERYRQLDPEVAIFVAGDRQTPHAEARSFIEALGNAAYYSDADQEKLDYKCSKIIGWNKIMRRNIALLEALRWRAEVIVSVDDDNIPLELNYFEKYRSILSTPYRGVMASSERGWINVGEFLIPRVYHRGFPYEFRNEDPKITLTPVSGARVGVAAGLWFGDPDIDAMERITLRPAVFQISKVLESGLVVDGACLSPFNSQNTAYIADLAPLMMVLVGIGRYDDIWASYIAQRVMAEMGYHIHFGAPFVWQQRNPQSLWKNLRDELFGMEFSARFCADLRPAKLGDGSVLIRLRRLYEHIRGLDYMPPEVYALGKAWSDDLEKVYST
jgi:hypothetical protein